MCSFGPHTVATWWYAVMEEVEVTQTISLLENGYNQRTVAESFDVTRNVNDRLWKHYQVNMRVY